MSSVAEPRIGRKPKAASPRTRARARRDARPRLLAGGVLWILLSATLLAGVVAVNVAVLRLNLELDRVGREHSGLQADVARIRSELSSAAASAEIEHAAENDLGLVQADPDTTVYVTLGPR